MRTKTAKQKIHVVTLGCAKNLVDSEVLMKQLDVQGITVEHGHENPDARTVIINTCGFIKDAKQESIDTILLYARDKEEGRIDNLFVMGCLSERYREELKKEIPEVDRYFGVQEMGAVLKQVGVDFKEELTGERKLTTPSHYAYLKISEGCDRKCSFCAIPLIRGRQVSRSISELKQEAELLAANGVKELILIAQDLTAYGMDLCGRSELAKLLDNLLNINNISWIRLHYTYPAGFPVDVLDMIKQNNRICNYIDVPVQHISDPVLRNMHRGINRSETIALLDGIRNSLPDASLRTTLLVGHPGEGEKEFQELKQWVKTARFERLGGFIYSEEDGTWGAKNLKDSIPEDEKLARLEEIMEIQQSISLELNEAKVGQVMQVIIDRKEGDFFIGRTEFDSPEVDNEVLVKSQAPIEIGQFANVHITSAAEFDLYGFAVK
jgi:ribosomal protein S12 methylthiotransferase